MTALSTKKTAAATIVATKSTPQDPCSMGSDRDCNECRRRRSPPTIAGKDDPAWFASVPYQGIRPRISRTSVVPIAATQPPTAGPPRVIAATIGRHRDGLMRTRVAVGPARPTRPTSALSRRQRRARISSARARGLPGCSSRPECDLRTSHRKHKSRDHERQCTQSHDSSDVYLRDRGIDCLVRRATTRTLALRPSRG